MLAEAYNRLAHTDKRIKVAAIAGIVGVILLLLSEGVPHSTAENQTKQEKQSQDVYEQYVRSLEEETAQLLSSIDGVGRCRVMITLKSSAESVYAKNTQENKNEGSYSGSYEYVLYDGSDGESPVLLKEYLPDVQGVAIVCDGADNTVVRENVVNSVSALFNLSVSKISVTKYKN